MAIKFDAGRFQLPIIAHPMYGAPIRDPIPQPPWVQELTKLIAELQRLIDGLLGRRA